MSCTIKFSSPLWGLTNGVPESDVVAEVPADIIKALSSGFPDLASRIIKDDGEINGSVKVYLNDKQLASLNDTDTKISGGDIIHIIPAVAGG